MPAKPLSINTELSVQTEEQLKESPKNELPAQSSVKLVSDLKEKQLSNSEIIRQKQAASSSSRLSPPSQAGAKIQETTTKQVKYLGLIIEKDAEYEEEEVDGVERRYVPIRDRYIQIVKLSRKLAIEALERRGGKDMRRTQKSLKQIGKMIRHIRFSQMEI